MADQPLSSTYKDETISSSQDNKQSEKRKPDPVLKAETNTNSYKRMKLKLSDPVETGNGSPPKEKKPKYKETSSKHVTEKKCHSPFPQTHSTRVKGDYNSMHSSASAETVSSVSGVGRADYFPPDQSFRSKSKTNLKYFDSRTDITKKKSSDHFPTTDTSRPKSKPSLALLSCKDENDPGLNKSLSSTKNEEILSNFKKPHKDFQKSLQDAYIRSSVKKTYYTVKTMKKNETELFRSQTTGESVVEKKAEEVAKLKQEILDVLVKACDCRTSLKSFERKCLQVKNSCKIVQEPEKAVNSNLSQSSSKDSQDIPIKECMQDNIKNLTTHSMKKKYQKVKNTEVIRTHLQEEQGRSTVMIEEGKCEKELSFKIPSKPADLNFVKKTNQNVDSKPLKAVTSEISLHKSVNHQSVDGSKNLERPTGKLEVMNFSDHAIHFLKSENLVVSTTEPGQFDKKINLQLSNNSMKKALHLLYMKATSNKLRKSESIQSNLQCHSNEHLVGKGKHLIKLEGKSKSSDEKGSSKQSESEPSLKKGKKLQITENTQHTKHSSKNSQRDPEWDVVVNEELKEHNLENKPASTRIASLPAESQVTDDKKVKSGDNKMTAHKEENDMKKVNLDDKLLSRGSKCNDAVKREQELPKQAEMKSSISEESKKVKVGLNVIKETGGNQKGVFGRIKVIDLRFKDDNNLSDMKKPEELKDTGSSEVRKKLNIALKPKQQNIDTSIQVSTERLLRSETKSTQTGIDSGPFTSTNNMPTLDVGTQASEKQVVYNMKEASTQTVNTKNKLNPALPSKEVVKKDTINLHEGEHAKNLKAGNIRTKEAGEADSPKRVVRKLRKTPDRKQTSSNHMPPVIIKTYKPEGLNEVTQEFIKSDYIEPEILEKETKSPLELLNTEVRRKREKTSAEYDKPPANVIEKSARAPKQSLATTASTKKSVKPLKKESKSSQSSEVIKKHEGIVKEPVIPTSTEYSLTKDKKSKIQCFTPVAPSKDPVSKTPDETQLKHMLEENLPKSIKIVHVHSQDTSPSEGDKSRQTKASLAANSSTIKDDSKVSETPKVHRETKQQNLPEKINTDVTESSRTTNKMKQSHLSEKAIIDSKQATEMKQTTSSKKPNVETKISVTPAHAGETKQLSMPEKPKAETKLSVTPMHAREMKQLSLPEKPDIDTNISQPSRHTKEIKESSPSEKPNAHAKILEPPKHSSEGKQSILHEKPNIDTKISEPCRYATEIKQSTLDEKPKTDPRLSEPSKQAREIKQSTMPEKPKTDMKISETSRHSREIKKSALPEKPKTETKISEPARHAGDIKQSTSPEKPNIDPKVPEPSRHSKEIKQLTSPEKPNIGTKISDAPKLVGEIKQLTSSEKCSLNTKTPEAPKYGREINQSPVSEKPYADPKVDKLPRHTEDIMHASLVDKPHTEEKLSISPKNNKDINQSPVSEKSYTDSKMAEPLRPVKDIKQLPLSEKPYTDPKKDETCRDAKQYTGKKMDESPKYSREPSSVSEKPHTDAKSDEPPRQTREIKQPTLSEKPHIDPKRDEPTRHAKEIKQTTLNEKLYIDPKQNEPSGDAKEVKQPTLSEKPHTDPERDEPPRYVSEVKQSTLTEKQHTESKINEPPRQTREIKQSKLSEKSYTEPKMDESHGHTREIKQSTVAEKLYPDQKVSETPRLSREMKQSPESEILKTDSKMTETSVLIGGTKQPSVSDKQNADLKVSETLKHKDAQQSPISGEPSTDSKMPELHRLFKEVKPPPTSQKQNIDPTVPETPKVLGEIKQSPLSRKTNTDKTHVEDDRSSINKYLEAEKRKGGTDNNDLMTKGSVKEEYTKSTSPKYEEKLKHKVITDQPKLQDESTSKLEGEKEYQNSATPKLQLKLQQSVKPKVIMTTPKDAKASKESTKHQKNIEPVSSKGSGDQPHSERPSLKKNFIAETMKKAEEERCHQVLDTKNTHETAQNVENANDTVKKPTAEERNAENATSTKSVVKQIEESVSKKSLQEEAARHSINVSPKSSKLKLQAQNQPDIKVCILPETQKKAVRRDPDTSVTQEQSTKTSSVTKVILQPDKKDPVSTHIKSSAKENLINAKQTTDSVVEKYEQVIKKQIPMSESEQRKTLEKSLGELVPAEPAKYFPSATHGKDVLLKGEKEQNQPDIKVCISPETQKKAVGKDPDKSVAQEQSTKTSSVAKVTLQPDQKDPVSTHIKSSVKENIINAKQTTDSVVKNYEQVIKKQIPMLESEQRKTLEKSLGELATAEPAKYFPSATHGKDVLLKGEKDEKGRWKLNDDKKKSEQNELNSKELNKKPSKPSAKDTAAIKMKEEPLVETYFVSKNFNRFFDSSHDLSGSSSSKAFTSDSTKSESGGQQGSEKKQRSRLGLKTNVVSEVRYKIDNSKKKDISHTKYTKIMSSESVKVGKQNRPTSAQGSQHPSIKTYLVSEFSRRTTKSNENFRLDQKPIDTEPLKTKDFRVLQGDKVDKVKDERSRRTPGDYQNEKSNSHQIMVKYDTGDQSSQKNSKSNEGKNLDSGKLDSGEPQNSDSGHQTRDESNEDPQADTQQTRKKTTDYQLQAAKELITKHLEMEQAMAPYLKHDQPKVVEYYKSKYMKDSVKNFLKAEGLERNTSKEVKKSMQGSSSEWKENVVTAKYPAKGLSQINKQYLHPENKVVSQYEESKPLTKMKSPKKDLSVVAKEYLRPSFISAGPLPPSPMPPSPYPPLPLPPLPPPSPPPPSPIPSPPLELESVSKERVRVKPVSSNVIKSENLHNKSRTRIIQGILDAGMKVTQEQEFERDTKKSFEKSSVKLSKESFVPVDESNPTDTEGLREPVKNLHLIENDIVTRTFKEIAPPLPKKEKLFPLRITSSKSITGNVSLEERLQNRAKTSVRDDNRLIPRPSTSAKLYPSSRYHEYRMADQRSNEQWDYDDPQLRGLSRHFNSSTIRGRANTAKATFLLVGLLSIYFLMKPEPPPPCIPVEGQPQLPQSQFQEPQLQQPYQQPPPLPPPEQQLGEPRPSE